MLCAHVPCAAYTCSVALHGCATWRLPACHHGLRLIRQLAWKRSCPDKNGGRGVLQDPRPCYSACTARPTWCACGISCCASALYPARRRRCQLRLFSHTTTPTTHRSALTEFEPTALKRAEELGICWLPFRATSMRRLGMRCERQRSRAPSRALRRHGVAPRN